MMVEGNRWYHLSMISEKNLNVGIKWVKFQNRIVPLFQKLAFMNSDFCMIVECRGHNTISCARIILILGIRGTKVRDWDYDYTPASNSYFFLFFMKFCVN